MRIHPMGNRPRSFYGDYDDSEIWEVMDHKIREEQRIWDDAYYRMNWWKRIRCMFAGEITESVGTSGGMELKPAAYGGMKCSVCNSTVILCDCGCAGRGADLHICTNPVCPSNLRSDVNPNDLVIGLTTV